MWFYHNVFCNSQNPYVKNMTSLCKVCQKIYKKERDCMKEILTKIKKIVTNIKNKTMPIASKVAIKIKYFAVLAEKRNVSPSFNDSTARGDHDSAPL